MKPPRKKVVETGKGLSIGRRAPSPAPAKSYDAFVNAILAVIRSIPKGRTASYGQVAALAGKPRGARQVSRVLHSLSAKEFLPWHRVINSNGCISLPMPGHGSLQASLLRKEKVEVSEQGRIDTARYGWKAGRASR